MLGLDPEMIIRSQFREYLDTIDDAETFVADMTASVGQSLGAQIDKLEGLMESVQTGAQGVVTAAASWMVSSVTVDPMAPAATVGVIASTVGSVKAASGQVKTLSTQLAEVVETISGWRLPIPSAVGAVSSLLQSATNALDVIPI